MERADQEKVNQYIKTLHLIPHHSQPGCLLADIYQGPIVDVDKNIFSGGKRPQSNAIYHMVIETAITQFNNVKSPKYWQYCDGSPQAVCIVDTKNKTFEEFILGDPLIHAALAEKLNKKLLQIICILPHQWIGAKLINNKSFSLITCTMTPGFDMQDFNVADINKAKILFPYVAKQIHQFFD